MEKFLCRFQRNSLNFEKALNNSQPICMEVHVLKSTNSSFWMFPRKVHFHLSSVKGFQIVNVHNKLIAVSKKWWISDLHKMIMMNFSLFFFVKQNTNPEKWHQRQPKHMLKENKQVVCLESQNWKDNIAKWCVMFIPGLKPWEGKLPKPPFPTLFKRGVNSDMPITFLNEIRLPLTLTSDRVNSTRRDWLKTPATTILRRGSLLHHQAWICPAYLESLRQEEEVDQRTQLKKETQSRKFPWLCGTKPISSNPETPG